MTLRRSIGFAWVLAAALLMPAHSAIAKGGKGSGAAVVIDSVQFFDLPGGKKNIEILGGGLSGNGGLPVVTLDGVIELEVLDATTTEISANVPRNTPDGDYSLMISTGSQTKQNAEIPIHLGGTLSVVCLDWYITTGTEIHVHVEGYVQDENGDAVSGALVTLENTVDGEVYQIYNSTTFKYAGYNHGESCPIELAMASGPTGQACCIGAAVDEGGDTGARNCPTGLYESLVLSVQAPPGSDRKWDGNTPDNEIQFDGP